MGTPVDLRRLLQCVCVLCLLSCAWAVGLIICSLAIAGAVCRGSQASASSQQSLGNIPLVQQSIRPGACHPHNRHL